MDLTAVNNIIVHSNIQTVWDLLKDPESIKQYLFGTDVSTDWQVGSPIIFRGEYQGKGYEDKGIILDVEPPRLLSYSYWSSMSGKADQPENYVNVTYRLEDENGSTKLTLSQDGIKTEKELEHLNENWKMVLEGIKKVAEKRQ